MGLLCKPVEGVLHIFGKARHGRKAIAVTLSVVTRIKEQKGVTCLVQWRGQWQHHFGIAAPTMQHGDRRSGIHIYGRNEPREQTLSVFSRDPDFRIGQAIQVRRLLFPDPRRTKIIMNSQRKSNQDYGN